MPVETPIYLDNHATTRCDPRVVEAMVPFFGERYGNAASKSHSFGFFAKSAVDRAREQVAGLLGCVPREIVWTSGATESDNLAVLGTARARRERGNHLITTAIEHKAVLDPCGHLEREGFEVTRLGVDADGRVRIAELEAALRPETILVSVMWANNEIGTVQPIAEIGRLCRAHGAVFHTDAAQAVGKLPIDVGAAQVDLLSLSAHKHYGPKGIGALYVRKGRPWLKLEPLQHGGGHERGLRSGTLPVPLIVGMGVAATLCVDDLAADGPSRLAALRDRLWAGIEAHIPGATVNGSLQHRLPGNLNVAFPGVEAEALMMAVRDVACSSGSACTSETLEPSHVLRALTTEASILHSSLRFGLGRFNTEAEIDHVIALLAEQVPRLQALNPA